MSGAAKGERKRGRLRERQEEGMGEGEGRGQTVAREIGRVRWRRERKKG